ncbi:MAG: methionine biosynthesis protein MetW [Aliidongia sp.]
MSAISAIGTVEAAAPAPGLRRDLKLIADLVAPGSRVLDIGCRRGRVAGLSDPDQGGRRPRHGDQPGRG